MADKEKTDKPAGDVGMEMDLVDPSGDEVAEVEEKGPDEEIAGLLAALEQHGIKLDAEKVKTPKDLVHHLTVAMHALNGMLEPSGAGDKVEESPMQGALSTETKVELSAEAKTKIEALTEKLSNSELAAKTEVINKLLSRGKATPDKVKKWKQVLTTHKLSLADDSPSTDIREVMAEINFAQTLPDGVFWDEKQRAAGVKNLSVQEEEPAGEQVWGKESTDPKRIEELADELLARVGVKAKKA